MVVALVLFGLILGVILLAIPASQTIDHRRRYLFQPVLEWLGERILPATYIWNGPENGNWSAANVWQDAKGDPKTLDRNDGNIQLRFTGGQQTKSVDDIPNLTISSLVITNTYGKAIALQQNLVVRSTTSGMTSESIIGSMASGTIKGAGNLTIRGGMFEWQGGTMGGTAATGTGKTIIDSLGGTLRINALQGTVFLDNRRLEIEEPTYYPFLGVLQGKVDYLTGTLQLDHGARIVNKGLFSAKSGIDLAIKTQSLDTSPAIINESKGTFRVEMVPTKRVAMYVRFTNTGTLHVASGSLEFGSSSENNGTIKLGEGKVEGDLAYSLPRESTIDVSSYWGEGTKLIGAGRILVVSIVNSTGTRKDAILRIRPQLTLEIPSTIELQSAGGSIAGEEGGTGGTLKLPQNARAFFEGVILADGVTIEATLATVILGKQNFVRPDGQRYILTPALYNGAKLINNAGAIELRSTDLEMSNGAEIVLFGAPPLNPTDKPVGGVMKFLDAANIKAKAGTTTAEITNHAGLLLKPDSLFNSKIDAVIPVYFTSENSRSIQEGAGTLDFRNVLGPPRKGRRGSIELRGQIGVGLASLTMPANSGLLGMGTVTTPLTTNSGEIVPGDVGQIGVISFLGDVTQSDTGHLRFDLASSVPDFGYDSLEVANLVGEPGGNVTLAGHLDVTVSYVPAPWTQAGTPGDYFAVVTATGSLSGQFDPLTGLNLPDPALFASALPALPSGHALRWRVIYDTTDSFDSALEAENPVFDPDNQPWTGNGTYDVVLLLEEVELPDLVITSVRPDGTDSLRVDFRLDTQEVTQDFNISVFASSDGVTVDDPSTPLDTFTVPGATVGDYQLTLDVSGQTLSSGGHLIVVVDDEGAVEEASEANNAIALGEFVALNASADEATGIFAFVLTLEKPSNQTVTVAYEVLADTSGTHPATAGADFTPITGTVTFAPGETSQVIAIPLADDAGYEYDETFKLHFSDPVNGYFLDSAGLLTNDAVATLTITDESDRPFFTILDASVAESNSPAQFLVALSNVSDRPITVDYASADDTAAAPGDYSSASGTLTFAPGELLQIIDVAINDDASAEADESFLLNLSNAANADLPSAPGIGTILNDDAPSVSISDVSQAEGNADSSGAGFTDFIFRVSLSGPSTQVVTVDFATVDGAPPAGAIAPGDYLPGAGRLVFEPGTTSKDVTVRVLADMMPESDESFFVDLTSAVNAVITDGQGQGTIENDDATLAITDVTQVEGNSGATSFTFMVTLAVPSLSTITVDYATAAGSAVFPGDFMSASGTVTFSPLETTKTITVYVNADNVYEINEDFAVNLSNAVNAEIGDSQGTGTIVNDDPVPTITIGDAAAVEGNSGTTNFTFTVTLSHPSQPAVIVNYATLNGTATTANSDYAAATGTLTFNAGETSKSITVSVNGDLAEEDNETFVVLLSSPINAALGADVTGQGTIQNDDTSVTISDASQGENSGTPLGFVLTLSKASALTVTVNWATANGTAAAGGDYASASGTATFSPGETMKAVSVFVIGDTVYEADETLVVNLSGATNAVVADSQGQGTIVNDDAQPRAGIGDAGAVEGNSGTTALTFTVYLTNASYQTVTVDYATADGVATTADSDYVAASGTVSFAPGETTKTVTVLANGDTKFEPGETFFVNLTNAVNTVIIQAQGQGTIGNDDSFGGFLPLGAAGGPPADFGAVLSQAAWLLPESGMGPASLGVAGAEPSAERKALDAVFASYSGVVPGGVAGAVTSEAALAEDVLRALFDALGESFEIESLASGKRRLAGL